MSEFALIERIRARAAAARAATAAPDLVLGIGDDAALLREQSGRELIVTTDLLVEEIDFKLVYAVPQWLGHKALAVSLSDIAAMGGTPRHVLLTLGLPATGIASATAHDFWEAFFDGFFALAAEHQVAVIGGDISRVPQHLSLETTVLGHCANGRGVRRDGARVGDAIFVTGTLGASAAGLHCLLAEARPSPETQSTESRAVLTQRAIRAHLRPEPRVAFGRALGASGLAHAMLDVSDGLAQDLAHLCAASQVSAVLEQAAIPCAPEIALHAQTPDEVCAFALTGGEDYELVFTAAPDAEPALQALAADCQLPLARIGTVVAREPAALLWLRSANGLRTALHVRGYDHFAS